MKAIEFEPSLVVALEDECYLQARLSLETRSNSYQVRTASYDEEPISIYFTLRQYPRPGMVLNPRKSLEQQFATGEDLVRHIVIPNIVNPIAAAIATAE